MTHIPAWDPWILTGNICCRCRFLVRGEQVNTASPFFTSLFSEIKIPHCPKPFRVKANTHRHSSIYFHLTEKKNPNPREEWEAEKSRLWEILTHHLSMTLSAPSLDPLTPLVVCMSHLHNVTVTWQPALPVCRDMETSCMPPCNSLSLKRMLVSSHSGNTEWIHFCLSTEKIYMWTQRDLSHSVVCSTLCLQHQLAICTWFW